MKTISKRRFQAPLSKLNGAPFKHIFTFKWYPVEASLQAFILPPVKAIIFKALFSAPVKAFFKASARSPLQSHRCKPFVLINFRRCLFEALLLKFLFQSLSKQQCEAMKPRTTDKITTCVLFLKLLQKVF